MSKPPDSSASFLFRLLTSPALSLRLIRYGLLWMTALGLIYRGFAYIATSIPSHAPGDVVQYSIASTGVFGGLTLGAYFIITKLTRRFILNRFQPGWFGLSLIGVHIISAELMLLHFYGFIQVLGLAHLPIIYSKYASYIQQLPAWKAPIDPIIVALFSFSLYYNYLLYAVGLKVFKDLFMSQLQQAQLQQQQAELKKENIRLEFEFLKAQINPHFLFNTLNNIYSFSVRSPEKVGDSVLKLADLMRYTLYDTSEELVPLQKEISFLTSYLDLQRIRHDEHVRIAYTQQGVVTTQRIPPLLFIIFVENAFKHGIQATAQSSWVRIELALVGPTLTLRVINSIPAHQPLKPPGLGLQNVRKRLDYLFAHRYQLHITPQPTQFSISLTLPLDESVLPGDRAGR
ncbi:sensor histidine kinase [Spirosoma endophyticum]|uniref:Histidine kinase n=1 Tax=Spirosoma endophyticum TaxID=662367 RepID=A0A1I2I8T9_9BACT|nr:sensor histidine kinase [Spirosoma endophyticum]SFF38073.1 Histidine kinase [Spirosoma endophyticum]